MRQADGEAAAKFVVRLDSQAFEAAARAASSVTAEFFTALKGSTDANATWLIQKQDRSYLLDGSYNELALHLARESANGASIHIKPNDVAGGPNGRGDKDVTQIRAFFVDFDGGDRAHLPNEVPIEPNMIVRTQRGQHWYWLAAEGTTIDEWQKVTDVLLAYFAHCGVDLGLRQPAHCMRVPGYPYRKAELQDGPFVPLMRCNNEPRYAAQEMLDAFLSVDSEKIIARAATIEAGGAGHLSATIEAARAEAIGKPASLTNENPGPSQELLAAYGDLAPVAAEFNALFERLVSGGAVTKGERNNGLYRLCARIGDHVTERDYFTHAIPFLQRDDLCAPPLPIKERMATVFSAAKRRRSPFGRNLAYTIRFVCQLRGIEPPDCAKASEKERYEVFGQIPDHAETGDVFNGKFVLRLDVAKSYMKAFLPWLVETTRLFISKDGDPCQLLHNPGAQPAIWKLKFESFAALVHEWAVSPDKFGNAQRIPDYETKVMYACITKYAPPLDGISSVPILAGGRLRANCYHRETHMWVHDELGIQDSDVPYTDLDAFIAAKKLLELTEGIVFASDIDRWVWLGMLLSAVGITWLGPDDPIPAFLVTSPQRNSGKSTLLQYASYVATGKGPRLFNWGTCSTELIKAFGGKVSGGFIADDNFKNGGTFGNHIIDSLITTRQMHPRKLGTHEELTIRLNSVIAVAGNNIDVAKDTSRRVLLCRLLPLPEERPTGWRGAATYVPRKEIGDKRPQITKQRRDYMIAALTMLRAGVVAGTPHLQAQNFTSWANLVARAIIVAQGPNIFTRAADRCTVPEEIGIQQSIYETIWDVFSESGTLTDSNGWLQASGQTRTLLQAAGRDALIHDRLAWLCDGGKADRFGDINSIRLGIALRKLAGEVFTSEVGQFRLEIGPRNKHGTLLVMHHLPAANERAAS